MPAPAATERATEIASAGEVSEALAAVVSDAERSDWHRLTLTDVTTGESFALDDFTGKTVYVDLIEPECVACLEQGAAVKDARDRLNPDGYAFVSLSTAGNAEALAAYAERGGFEWVFALATPELLAALNTTFGSGITAVGSTPHFILSPEGAVSMLSTGQHSADDLIAQLTAASGA
jgi:hypothetical protein